MAAQTRGEEKRRRKSEWRSNRRAPFLALLRYYMRLVTSRQAHIFRAFQQSTESVYGTKTTFKKRIRCLSSVVIAYIGRDVGDSRSILRLFVAVQRLRDEAHIVHPSQGAQLLDQRVYPMVVARKSPLSPARRILIR